MKNVRASHRVRTLTRRGRRCALLAATLTALIFSSEHVASTSAAGQAAGQPGQTLVAEREITMKITAPFTLAAVGDLIMRNPAVDLGQDGSRPFSRLGLPMIPASDMSRRVLEKLQRLSKPFGTTINVENGVGVIRVSAGRATR
jgi:hypothetical protein